MSCSLSRFRVHGPVKSSLPPETVAVLFSPILGDGSDQLARFKCKPFHLPLDRDLDANGNLAAPGAAERGPPETALEVRGGGAGESCLREEGSQQVRTMMVVVMVDDVRGDGWLWSRDDGVGCGCDDDCWHVVEIQPAQAEQHP